MESGGFRRLCSAPQGEQRSLSRTGHSWPRPLGDEAALAPAGWPQPENSRAPPFQRGRPPSEPNWDLDEPEEASNEEQRRHIEVEAEPEDMVRGIDPKELLTDPS